MKRIWLIFVCLAVAALAASAAMADASYTDPAGDAQGGAPDITSVSVANDAAGTVTMIVTAPIIAESTMLVHLDTNMNGKCGDTTDPHLAVVGVGPGIVIPVAFRPDASGDLQPTSISSLAVTATASTVTFRFAKADVGIDTGFAFWLETATGAQLEAGQVGDEMPDGNYMPLYLLTTPTPAPTPAPTPTPVVVKPLIGAPATTPTLPVAGKRFTITFPVTRSDSGAPLAAGTMVCDPSVQGKVIQHAESFKAGKARLSFVVPKAAKGKALKVKVTIKAGTQSTTKVASYRVK